jgi:hypothetical protein
MRKVTELLEWCAGAAAEFGDASAPVCQMFFRWEENLIGYREDELVCGVVDGQFCIGLGPIGLVRVDIEARGPLVDGDQLVAFGAESVTTGVWSLAPSLNIPGRIHGFVVLHGVPDPAPWERRILVPA